MLKSELVDDLRVRLHYVESVDLDHNWNYTNVLSPFSRIYLITKGKGQITPNQDRIIDLQPGYLYIIPSFTVCSYLCDSHLSQYYLSFTSDYQSGNKLIDFLDFNYCVKATELDYLLFERLEQINPNRALEDYNPRFYQPVPSEYTGNTSAQLETAGIIKQLISRFIFDQPNFQANTLYHFREVFRYIDKHLSDEIRIEKLAEIACYSKDHFTRLFKQLTKYLPIEYVNRKRIDRAKFLLITSKKSQKEISQVIGFTSQQYYNRVFQKYIGYTPSKSSKITSSVIL